MDNDTQSWVCTIPNGEPWITGISVAEKLLAVGFETFAAGGCVRDLILGLSVQDIDLATAANPDQVEEIFAQQGWQTVAVGKSFGVVVVITPSGHHVEVATFRNDGVYIDGRRPEGVTFSTAKEDVERRDYTINALLIDLTTGIISDYVGGKHDLEHKIIRAVGDAAARLQEDRLRVLRALRFAARLGFRIDAATWDAVCTTSLDGVSQERIVQEWSKAMSGPGRGAWLAFLVASGQLVRVCSPLAACAATDYQTLQARLDLLHEADTESVILALWLLPAALAEATAWMESMPLASALRRTVTWLLNHGSDPNTLRQQRLATRRRSWRHADGAQLARLLAICYGDAVVDLVAEQAAERGQTLPPLLRAEDLMALGVQPGPQFGALLQVIQDQQLEGLLSDHQSAMVFARQWLSDN